jgi:hypothetical protein
MWMSATVLDLAGGNDGADAARRLLGLGVLAAVPSAVTGWAEWASAPRQEQRVGVVHALAKATALILYGASWRARRHQAQGRGKLLCLVAGAVAIVGGYLEGHLVEVRKISSRHPAFVDDRGR